MREPIIHDGNAHEFFAPVVDGEVKGHGLVERKHSVYPAEMFQAPGEMKLIPRSEWRDRIKEKERTRSQLSDLLLDAGIDCLDQGPNGYCWSHSSVHAVIARRCANGQKHVPLSAYSVAATIKRGRNEGGWCGLSAQFIRTKGIAPQSMWPQGDRNYTQYDRPEVWSEAAKYKSVEEWVDLTRNVYDQNLTFDMVATCVLLNNPCPVDFNWWAHSVLAVDLVEIESGSFGLRIWNSWGKRWGANGFGILQGQKAIPNGALCIRAVAA